MSLDGYTLRRVDDSDHAWLVALHNDPEVLRNLTHPSPITMEQHMAWWNSTKHDLKQARFIFCLDGARVGFAKIYDIDYVNRNCVLGADIEKSYRGYGHAKHLWQLMLGYCFGDHALKLHRVSLTTAAFNNVGQRVYRGLGFREEGRKVQSLLRDDMFHDQIAMFMLRDDWVQR